MVCDSMLKSTPLLKIALPFVGGIALGWYCNISLLYICCSLALSFVLLLLSFFNIAPKWKLLFGVGVVGVMFSLGLLTECLQSNEKEQQWGADKCEYRARIVEVPLMRGTNIKVLAELSLPDTLLSGVGRNKGLVYLYFTPTVETETLHIGDVITFEGSVSPPENRGNPAEFDVKKYYYVKNLSGTVFVPNGKWNLLRRGEHDVFTLALRAREHVVTLYKRSGFDENSLALLTALTLGEKRDFPKELKENYSIAGASHVLALSGLHLGIFYMLLSFFVPYRGRRRGVIIFRELLIVSALWVFAFIAGLSPSVVRAAILFTLMSLARCLGRDVSSLSSLSFAALAMLVFNPHLLFDVSFQLSFSAVLAILLLVPPLSEALKVHRYGVVGGYIANLLILSLVAQVGTLPFVWYHFGVFPIYFLLTNIVVVPLAFVVMLLAVSLWIVTPVAFLSQMVSWLLSGVVSFMNTTVGRVASLPGASLALPELGVLEILVVFLLAAIIIYSLAGRKWRLLLLISVVVAVLLGVYRFTGNEVKAGNYLLIYNNRKNPLLHVVNGKANYLLSTVPQLDAEYEYSSAPYVKREGLDEPVWVEYGYSDSLLTLEYGLLSYSGLKIRLVDNAFWADNIYSEPADVVILCRGFLGSMKDLLDVYPTECLVLDASLYKRSRKRIMRECAALDVDVLDVSEIGALMLLPNEDSFEFIGMRGK